MKRWEIHYWINDQGKNLIEQWLKQLTKEQFKSVAKEIIMLELAGNELKLPHSKALGKGLFESRERTYGYRIYYAFTGKKVIILLAAGNKKGQKNDIEIARERLLELEL